MAESQRHCRRMAEEAVAVGVMRESTDEQLITGVCTWMALIAFVDERAKFESLCRGNVSEICNIQSWRGWQLLRCTLSVA